MAELFADLGRAIGTRGSRAAPAQPNLNPAYLHGDLAAEATATVDASTCEAATMLAETAEQLNFSHILAGMQSAISGHPRYAETEPRFGAIMWTPEPQSMASWEARRTGRTMPLETHAAYLGFLDWHAPLTTGMLMSSVVTLYQRRADNQIIDTRLAVVSGNQEIAPAITRDPQKQDVMRPIDLMLSDRVGMASLLANGLARARQAHQNNRADRRAASQLHSLLTYTQMTNEQRQRMAGSRFIQWLANPDALSSELAYYTGVPQYGESRGILPANGDYGNWTIGNVHRAGFGDLLDVADGYVRRLPGTVASRLRPTPADPTLPPLFRTADSQAVQEAFAVPDETPSSHNGMARMITRFANRDQDPSRFAIGSRSTPIHVFHGYNTPDAIQYGQQAVANALTRHYWDSLN